MKNLKKDMQAVTKGLKALARKTEAMAKKVAKQFHESEKHQTRMAGTLGRLTKAELLTRVSHFQDKEHIRREFEEMDRQLRASTAGA